MNWNPFAHLIEVKNKRYRLSRLKRSKFIWRVRDTFRVFYGDIIDNDLGLLDYLIPLARPYQALSIYAVLKGKLSLQTVVVGILATISALALNIPKFLLAAVLTIIAMPIIALVHRWFKPSKTKYKNDMEKTSILWTKENGREIDHAQEKTLKPFLGEDFFKTLSDNWLYPKGLVIELMFNEEEDENLMYWRHEKTSVDNPHKYFLSFMPRLVDSSISSPDYDGYNRYKEGCSNGGTLAVIEIKPENVAGIKALLETNTFWATESLERDDNDALSVVEGIIEGIEHPGKMREAIRAGLLTGGFFKSERPDENVIPIIDSYADCSDLTEQPAIR